MIQDLTKGRLENEYYDKFPEKGDTVLFYSDKNVLLKKTADGEMILPDFEDAQKLKKSEAGYRYLFRLWDKNFFLCEDYSRIGADGFFYEQVRQVCSVLPKHLGFAVMTGEHLYLWYKNNRFCGNCGERTVHDSRERMLYCPQCNNMIFPRISPAVIIAVTDGDRLILSKYAGRTTARYALIAGYTEIGETLEQTVKREVKEEVGLTVDNIRYYKSQPWGVDGNILMGFFCDLKGQSGIDIDEKELSFADWFERENIPVCDDGISLTQEMIRVFKEGKEP